MSNLTYNKAKHGEFTLSNDSIDESVLAKPHYKLSDFTTENGQAYAINTNNNFAYPIIGKRFDSQLKAKNPSLSNERCNSNVALKIDELKYSQEPEDLINWQGLSRHLAGNISSVGRKRYPKKYDKKVSELVDLIDKWMQE